MPIEFREMIIYDYQNVIDLWHNTENLGLSNADHKNEIEVFLTRNPGLCFVAVEDSKIIGAVLAGHDGRRGAIYHLAVQMNKRNQGVGSQLIKLCLHGLKIAGIERCHIHVYANNQSGLEFWQKEGWYLRSELALLSFDIS